MKNSYVFTNGYCGTLVVKREILKIKDNSAPDAKIPEGSTLNIGGAPPPDNSAINGKLYHNIYLSYCLCCITPNVKSSY